ncbi:MAG: tRNA (guanosine(37)-N1)-methyltransferase TrmD [Gammaproteobacteria bacterium]|jgi:tRNA (guanine37-N1)-methyltransferase|nr:tRNA (guanosine(37)-N1)-methyltransferase TrmD [Gammaproteobacteria bacterium]MBT3723309.1 tRNA (guanosine(37)-N1)-methyltransferase TrmD [Gammaproteobacteria bacterium]MBT4076123.1 tRNA (guanosine(37)-N1)-methyltransferase TrmD [Gammaproteobacteria bacterium]MBT4194548.1 tRNA (guanosine(37)-N1)-methyltransferase TrmD [Gammaproteobacteria bacterium]MBT4449785.1 tRNA (guanosine(37)-N1)-methyltransferase TrmD [Gammaproteobacteria bacterium]
MRIDVITLFPEMVQAVIEYGVVGRASDKGLLQLTLWNPRDYTKDKHRSVDDRPYGGGPGMLMKVVPLQACIAAVRLQSPDARLVYLSPQGSVLKQKQINQAANWKNLILLCGRYEGIDERILQQEVDEEWSIGDYVISGGELAAMVCIDAITRQIPGALGHQDSAELDSFSAGLLDCPHYTRPESINGLKVPDVLLNGNHRLIEEWRDKQALGKTWKNRPDLLEKMELNEKQRKLLKEFIAESE